jgi:hypothetical protein
VGKRTCQRVLSELCGFAKTDHFELDNICLVFEQEYEAFLIEMIPIMAWILAWRRNGNDAHLDNIEMSHLFSLKNGHLQVNPTPKGKEDVTAYLHDRCKVTFDTFIDIKQFEADFRQKGIYRKFIRGKFVLWFLIEFCNSVHRDAVVLFNGITKPPKIHVSLSSSNGMAVIGVRARIPSSLREFLKSTFCSYIERVEIKTANSGDEWH